MDIKENKELLKTFTGQIKDPRQKGLPIESIRAYVMKEGITLASLSDNSRILLSEEEEDKLKEEGMFLFYALSLLPKKVEFFWRVVSLVSYMKKEILKMRSFFSYNQEFGTQEFPFPFFVDKEFLKDFDFILKQATKTISSETKREKVIKGANNILIFLERMQQKVYLPFWEMIEGEKENIEENYIKSTHAYESNLRFLAIEESKITAFLGFAGIDGTISKISNKVFKNFSTKESMDITAFLSKIKEEGTMYYSGTPKKAEEKIFCQANFGGSFLQDYESILAVSPSDFILHFLIEQPKERIRRINIFFIYQLMKIHKSQDEIRKNIEIDSINNNFALKDVKIQNTLLEEEYSRLKKIETLQDVLQNGVIQFYKKVEKATRIKVFDYLNVESKNIEDVKAFLDKSFTERTLVLFQFIKESIYENKKSLPSANTEFYRELEEEMLSDVIMKLMTEVSLRHKEKEKELRSIVSQYKENTEETEDNSTQPTGDESKAQEEEESENEAISLSPEGDSPQQEEIVYADSDVEYAEEGNEPEEDDDECHYDE